MSEWQPIETAPRDEEFLGVRIEEGRYPKFWVIHGIHMQYGGEEDDPSKGLTWKGQDCYYGIELTHWMPLPPAPEN